MDIKITMEDATVRAVLDRGLAAAQDFGPALDDIAGELLALSDGSFSLKADPSTGIAWPNLQPATIRERERKGFNSSDTLQRTRHLRQSIQTEIGSDFVEIGASAEYALIHHLGGKTGRKGAANIPARPFVGADDDNLLEFGDILRNHLINAMGI